MSIDNAQPLEASDERATQLVRLQEVTAAISRAVELEQVLHLIVDGLGDIFTGSSCAIRLYDPDRDEFGRWAAAGVLKDWQASPRSKGTSRYVISIKAPLYIEDTSVSPPEGQPAVRRVFIDQGVRAIAHLPLLSKGDVIGVLYVDLATPHRFSQDEKRILELFANQAAIAIENARLYHDLERRIRELEVLTEIGRTISNLGIDEILDLVYEQAAKIMDLSVAQVQIAFYDEAKDKVSFPLAVEKDNGKIVDVIRWGRREARYRKSGKDEEVEQFKPRPTGTRYGLTEYVIRTEQPLLIAEDFKQKAAELDIRGWPTFGRLDRPTHSWLGVPMIVQGRVIGMISIQSLEVEHAFSQEHVELLTTVASQAAVAIENARLYDELEAAYLELEQAQEQRIAAEKFAHLGTVAAALGHRMNSVAGMVRVCERELRDLVDLENEEISDNLDTIAEEVAYMLALAEGLFMPTEAIEEQLELTDLNLLLRDAVDKAPIPSDIDTTCIYADGLPPIPANKWFVEMFRELIANAITAMEGVKGQLRVESRLADDRWVEVLISDNGSGIPPEDREHIFNLFFSHREEESVDEEEGMGAFGFGLWWVKTFLVGIGGSIDFESEVGKGTTFTVKLPVVR